MKKILTATLPALALLALGGCASTGAISSTEDDGVYYSSADRTTVAPPVARTQADGYGYETARVQTQTIQTTEDANPDYQGDGTQTTDNGTDYYDDSYVSGSPSGFGQPYTGPGVSTYNYTPNWSVAPSFYGSPFGYGLGMSIGFGYGGGFGGYSPFGFGYPAYAGLYDPFFSPYGYGSAFGYGLGGFGSHLGLERRLATRLTMRMAAILTVAVAITAMCMAATAVLMAIAGPLFMPMAPVTAMARVRY
jgi:hypothetical protein